MCMDYDYVNKSIEERNVLSIEVPLPDAKELATSINDEILSHANENKYLPDNMRVNIIVLRRILQYFEKEEAADLLARGMIYDHMRIDDPLQCNRCGRVFKSAHEIHVHQSRNVSCLRVCRDKIKIHNFGDEDTSHVTDEVFGVCVQDLPSGITMLIDHVFKNSNYPANLNTRKIDESTMHVLIDGVWTVRSSTDILLKKIQKVADLISEYQMRRSNLKSDL